MNSFLICCYPRSRSYWLSEFFSVPGICQCDHEATEHAASAQEFWENAERCGEANYGNSDSANIFVLPALLAARPLTKVIWIERPFDEVIVSMDAAGFTFSVASQNLLRALKERYRQFFDFEVPYKDLARWEVIHDLWRYLLPDAPFDAGRWGIMDAMKLNKDAHFYENHPCRTDKFLAFIRTEGESVCFGEMSR